MNQGYIKLYRSLLEKGFYNNSKYVHLWIHILLKANWEEKEILWNGKLVKLKSGQFITGRKTLSKETKIKESTIEDILKTFENEQQIRQRTTTKFRIITIQNWDKYQDASKNPTAKATTEQQQSDTDKKDNKEKKESYSTFLVFFKELLRKEKGITPSLGAKDERAFWEFLENHTLEDAKDICKFYFNSNLGNKFWSLATILQPAIINPWQLEKAKASEDYE